MEPNTGRTVGFRTEDSPLFVSLLCRRPPSPQKKIYVYWSIIYQFCAISVKPSYCFLIYFECPENGD